MKPLEEIRSYYLLRADELIGMSKNGDPWVFLCCSSFIDFLVKLLYPNGNGQDYKDFIKTYLGVINDKYINFEFANGKKDLDVQIYHVLRCGIIHRFSLTADDAALGKGGRDRSIVIVHEHRAGNVHLTPFIRPDKQIDSVVFTAESFAKDLKYCAEYIFNDVASNSTNIKHTIETNANRHLPIGMFDLS